MLFIMEGLANQTLNSYVAFSKENIWQKSHIESLIVNLISKFFF